MQVVAKCPKCDSSLPVEAADTSGPIKCGRCGTEIPLEISPALRSTAAVISAIFYWYRHDFIAYGILAAAALIDLIIYGRLKDVTVCYRCHSEFRGKYPRTARPFDLHTADVLEQEYERRIGRR
jgi:uncharacterized paraquat-inducible protein A